MGKHVPLVLVAWVTFRKGEQVPLGWGDPFLFLEAVLSTSVGQVEIGAKHAKQALHWSSLDTTRAKEAEVIPVPSSDAVKVENKQGTPQTSEALFPSELSINLA